MKLSKKVPRPAWAAQCGNLCTSTATTLPRLLFAPSLALRSLRACQSLQHNSKRVCRRHSNQHCTSAWDRNRQTVFFTLLYLHLMKSSKKSFTEDTTDRTFFSRSPAPISVLLGCSGFNRQFFLGGIVGCHTTPSATLAARPATETDVKESGPSPRIIWGACQTAGCPTMQLLYDLALVQSTAFIDTRPRHRKGWRPCCCRCCYSRSLQTGRWTAKLRWH